MKIVVGLGNPGRKYERTRHNAGFMAADELARLLPIDKFRDKYRAFIGMGRIDSETVLLAKPRIYMNESGTAVALILRECYAAIADLIVIHDEIDLALGTVRIKKGGGHGGHNGIRSIMGETGSPDFIRVRVGIGRPPPSIDPADYVLKPFFPDERRAAAEAVTRAAEAAKLIVTEGATQAMNLINQKS